MKFEVKMTIEVSQKDLLVYMLKNGLFDDEVEALENELDMHVRNCEELTITDCTVTCREV